MMQNCKVAPKDNVEMESFSRRKSLAKYFAFFSLLIFLSLAANRPADFVTAVSQGNSNIVYLPMLHTSKPISILIFSKTEGFRHPSIPVAIDAISVAATSQNWTVVATESADDFTDDNLAQFNVVMFLNTTGDVLDDAQQAVFERYIQAGGGFVGIHSATDTEYDWAWYEGLIGTYFKNHPAIQQAELQIIDATHISTIGLPSPWSRTDEWYNFQSNLPAGISVLIEVDEGSYSGGEMGNNHPISWYHEYDGGRAWYTAMGHTVESYNDSLFIDHILGGIRWVANDA